MGGLVTVRGAALFVRVSGGVAAVFWASLIAVVSLGASNWYIALPAYVVLAFTGIRPWLMGVDVRAGEVRVRSWFRVYVLRAGEISAVRLEQYSGLAGFAVGWVPFVGAIRVIQIEYVEGRTRLLRSTVNRRNRCLRLQRVIAESLGVKAA